MLARMSSRLLDPRLWPFWAMMFSAAILAGAHAFETFGRLAACPLCLRQREVYWAAIAIAAIGLIVIRFMRHPRMTMTLNTILCLVFITSAVIAGYHAGVEWHLWKGPEGCAAGASNLPASAAEIDLDQRFAIASCTEAAWRMFGISMAGYNVLISIGLAFLSAISARRAMQTP